MGVDEVVDKAVAYLPEWADSVGWLRELQTDIGIPVTVYEKRAYFSDVERPEELAGLILRMPMDSKGAKYTDFVSHGRGYIEEEVRHKGAISIHIARMIRSDRIQIRSDGDKLVVNEDPMIAVYIEAPE